MVVKTLSERICASPEPGGASAVVACVRPTEANCARACVSCVGYSDMPGSLSTGSGSDTPPSKRVRRQGEEGSGASPSSPGAGASSSANTMER